MAKTELTRRGKAGFGPPTTPGRPTRELDPFERMRAVLSWDPFREWPSRFSPAATEDVGFVPAFEVRETNDAYVFKADLPGVREEDLEINVTGNRLTVSGRRESEREEEERGDYYFYERSYGSFSRSFTLPDDADTDRVEAELHSGVLALDIPKRAESQARRIKVRGEHRSEEAETEHDGGGAGTAPEQPGAHA